MAEPSLAWFGRWVWGGGAPESPWAHRLRGAADAAATGRRKQCPIAPATPAHAPRSRAIGLGHLGATRPPVEGRRGAQGPVRTNGQDLCDL